MYADPFSKRKRCSEEKSPRSFHRAPFLGAVRCKSSKLRSRLKLKIRLRLNLCSPPAFIEHKEEHQTKQEVQTKNEKKEIEVKSKTPQISSTPKGTITASTYVEIADRYHKKENYKEAEGFYQLAAEQGNLDAEVWLSNLDILISSEKSISIGIS